MAPIDPQPPPTPLACGRPQVPSRAAPSGRRRRPNPPTGHRPGIRHWLGSPSPPPTLHPPANSMSAVNKKRGLYMNWRETIEIDE